MTGFGIPAAVSNAYVMQRHHVAVVFDPLESIRAFRGAGVFVGDFPQRLLSSRGRPCHERAGQSEAHRDNIAPALPVLFSVLPASAHDFSPLQDRQCIKSNTHVQFFHVQEFIVFCSKKSMPRIKKLTVDRKF